MTLIFDLKIKFTGFFTWIRVWPITSVCFDIDIPYLELGSITMRGCVAYLHDPDTTLTFDPKVKIIGFMTWLCVRATAFLSFDTVTLCLAHECITMVRCVVYIHYLSMTLTFDLNIKIKFSPGIWVWQDPLCFVRKAYQILTYGCIAMRQHIVYILNLCMTSTFDLYVGGLGYP